MKKRIKAQLPMSEINLDRLNSYLLRNDIKFASLVRNLIVKYFDKKDLR